MKVVVSIVSSLIAGWVMAYNGFVPFIELKTILENRRRVMFSVLALAVGFVFVMAFVLLGVIEAALQYEAQGFVLWNALLSVATGFFVLGLFSFILAKVLWPKPQADLGGLLKGLDAASLLALVEQFMPAEEPFRGSKEASEEPREQPNTDFNLDPKIVRPDFAH